MLRKYLFFDLDGTLTDPMEGITRSVEYALRHFGIEVIRHALDRLGIAPEEAVMIGDRRYDIEGAAAAGLDSIAVGWGYAAPGELEAARPGHFAADVEALRRLLL